MLIRLITLLLWLWLRNAGDRDWHEIYDSLSPLELSAWTQDPTCEEGSGKNLARKCLERWNAAVSVDEHHFSQPAFEPNDRK